MSALVALWNFRVANNPLAHCTLASLTMRTKKGKIASFDGF